MRLYYYVSMTALRDSEIQKKGIVFILYAVGKRQLLGGRPSKLAALWSIIPMRIRALHFCYDTPLMDFGAKVLCHAMESRFLCRLRLHKGRLCATGGVEHCRPVPFASKILIHLILFLRRDLFRVHVRVDDFWNTQ